MERTERRPLVVVDYLQKVHVPKMPVEDERATVVVEGLKDLALDLEVPVLAIVAADKEGLGPGRRVRLHHLRGSSALAYEADIVLILNDKYEIVAKHHLVYDPANADRYRQHVVLSVEKNRSGLDRIDLQLRKRFEQARVRDRDGAGGRAAARRPRLQGVGAAPRLLLRYRDRDSGPRVRASSRMRSAAWSSGLASATNGTTAARSRSVNRSASCPRASTTAARRDGTGTARR